MRKSAHSFLPGDLVSVRVDAMMWEYHRRNWYVTADVFRSKDVAVVVCPAFPHDRRMVMVMLASKHPYWITADVLVKLS